MATVCCRALYVVKWYEISRVLTVSSTLVTTKNYRNETWCKRWWHFSQRNFSTTRSYFAPNLSPIFAKGMENICTKEKKSKSTKDDKAEKQLVLDKTDGVISNVTVTYHRGLPKIIVPLPSRKEHCVFVLKPITHTVGDFIQMLKKEDGGIDRASVTTIDGIRIGSNNTIESLMENDFRLIINDAEYLVQPPLHHKHTMENIEKLSDIQILIGQLYETFHVREHHVNMEKQVLTKLEAVRLELEPLEQKLQEIESTANRRANIFIWVCLVLMSIQFSGLARLTWWEYSWDIMEPITYFVNYGTTMALFIYFVLTKQEYILPDVMNRRQLITLHKKAKKLGFNLNHYNYLKDRAYELETTLKIIRGPLYEHKNHIEQKERERSSSSSSRSPSSSPSPSPSPERTLPKKEKMAIAASENYQLKWHSYGAHLHSSVATLLHSESFADVLLATSCGRHVAAHRFVLAACSSYLSHIFQTCHFGANTNAPIIVVLPTEIGYRTLKILIQYMYSGEATVTNDQLEGVLKAGDILRVRGLWRSNTGSKKENIQSNNQKMDREKREQPPLTGQIQKIKLVQPSAEKIVENTQQNTPIQNNIQPQKPMSERKSIEKIEEKTNEPESKKVLEENKNNEQNKNKENVENNGKKRKTTNSDVESNKSKSEDGENTELNLELLVKDEPIWEETIDPSESLTIDHEIDIKPEIVHSADEEEEYSPLTCDMCSQTFNRPSDWVRHIEFTHADMTENRRKKRKGDVDDDSKDFPPLKCDLCGNMYSTPQEWVRHIQTEHTEEQLALMNNSAPPKPKRVHSHQKLCNICQKEFPSHASMVIHQRTHTGEKPFLCSYCKKGFNVKSNLLRHLRTLHDKYVHPSLYGSNGNTNA